jgi:hypothetical protein
VNRLKKLNALPRTRYQFEGLLLMSGVPPGLASPTRREDYLVEARSICDGSVSLDLNIWRQCRDRDNIQRRATGLRRRRAASLR